MSSLRRAVAQVFRPAERSQVEAAFELLDREGLRLMMERAMPADAFAPADENVPR
jgi:hypothetical protein